MALPLIPFVEAVEDARVKGTIIPATGSRAKVLYSPDRQQVRLYCVSCHHPGAFISEDIPGVIYLCDAVGGCGCDCAGTKGELPLPRLAL
jgi:hypothetical protein